MSLPSAMPYEGRTHWTFGKNEIQVIRMLRDWPNGHTASRPHSWVLIYGRHPLWVHQLREAGVKVIGMFREKTRWPYYVVGDPLQHPFKQNQFQVYVYDDFIPKNMGWFAVEVSRIIKPNGFFLYPYSKNGGFEEYLEQFDWKRFEWDFHEFTIWWRPKNYDHIELNLSILFKYFEPTKPKEIKNEEARRLSSSA